MAHIVTGVGKYTLIDLFAGCGGLTRGFEDTGRFRSIFAVECDRDAAETYRLNFGDHVAEALIEDVASFPSADVVIGGPPCQGFSPLNRDAVGFERRGLWRSTCARSSRRTGGLSDGERARAPAVGGVRGVQAASAEELGFRVDGRVLNAADFGVPQRRRRAIVIGTRSGDVPWPVPTHADPNGPDGVGGPPWRTFREAVEGLPLRPDGFAWHRPRNPRPESVRRYKAVPRDGGDRFAMQRNLDRAGLGRSGAALLAGEADRYHRRVRRLWWDRPAYTIRTEFYKPEKGRYLHPSAHRPITVREAARCMSFPTTSSSRSIRR